MTPAEQWVAVGGSPAEFDRRRVRLTVEIEIVDSLYFVTRTPCGQAWTGMRHSEDVKIIAERAMDHAAGCTNCRTA